MAFKNHRSKKDHNFNEFIRALKDRCAGYHKDAAYPNWHYANLQGLKVCAYDLNKVGSGFPDGEIWVSWFCLQMEVKQERLPVTLPGTQGRHTEVLTNDEYYRAQLEDTEVFYRLHHSSIVPIVWDRNQIFEWIKAMVDFVLYVEGKAEGSRELLAIFFPKIAEEHQANTWA